MNWIWAEGRLRWPLVALIVYGTVSVVIFDYVWRIVIMPFVTLLAAGLAAYVAGLVILLLLVRLANARRSGVGRARQADA